MSRASIAVGHSYQTASKSINEAARATDRSRDGMLSSLASSQLSSHLKLCPRGDKECRCLRNRSNPTRKHKLRHPRTARTPRGHKSNSPSRFRAKRRTDRPSAGTGTTRRPTPRSRSGSQTTAPRISCRPGILHVDQERPSPKTWPRLEAPTRNQPTRKWPTKRGRSPSISQTIPSCQSMTAPMVAMPATTSSTWPPTEK